MSGFTSDTNTVFERTSAVGQWPTVTGGTSESARRSERTKITEGRSWSPSKNTLKTIAIIALVLLALAAISLGALAISGNLGVPSDHQLWGTVLGSVAVTAGGAPLLYFGGKKVISMCKKSIKGSTSNGEEPRSLRRQRLDAGSRNSSYNDVSSYGVIDAGTVIGTPPNLHIIGRTASTGAVAVPPSAVSSVSRSELHPPATSIDRFITLPPPVVSPRNNGVSAPSSSGVFVPPSGGAATFYTRPRPPVSPDFNATAPYDFNAVPTVLYGTRPRPPFSPPNVLAPLAPNASASVSPRFGVGFPSPVGGAVRRPLNFHPIYANPSLRDPPPAGLPEVRSPLPMYVPSRAGSPVNAGAVPFALAPLSPLSPYAADSPVNAAAVPFALAPLSPLSTPATVMNVPGGFLGTVTPSVVPSSRDDDEIVLRLPTRLEDRVIDYPPEATLIEGPEGLGPVNASVLASLISNVPAFEPAPTTDAPAPTTANVADAPLSFGSTGFRALVSAPAHLEGSVNVAAPIKVVSPRAVPVIPHADVWNLLVNPYTPEPNVTITVTPPSPTNLGLLGNTTAPAVSLATLAVADTVQILDQMIATQTTAIAESSTEVASAPTVAVETKAPDDSSSEKDTTPKYSYNHWVNIMPPPVVVEEDVAPPDTESLVLKKVGEPMDRNLIMPLVERQVSSLWSVEHVDSEAAPAVPATAPAAQANKPAAPKRPAPPRPDSAPAKKVSVAEKFTTPGRNPRMLQRQRRNNRTPNFKGIFPGIRG